jgi:hypothetical protein
MVDKVPLEQVLIIKFLWFFPANYYFTIAPCASVTVILRCVTAMTRSHIVTSLVFKFKALFSDLASESYVFLIPYV